MSTDFIDTPWLRHAWQPSHVPTMVTPTELRYLHWLTSTRWDGRSDTVEFGPWLGATTLAIAAGMQDNPNLHSGTLHTFDNFRWRPFMTPRAPTVALPNDTDFSHVLRQNLGDLLDRVCIHHAELPGTAQRVVRFPTSHIETTDHVAQFDWRPPRRVGVLFIDGAKSHDAMCRVLEHIVPSMTPTDAYIACQDYADPWAYWVPMLMELNKPHWSVAHVLPSNTVTLTRDALLDTTPVATRQFADISAEMGVDLLDAAADAIDGHGNSKSAHLIRLGACLFLADKHCDEAARQRLHMECRRFPLTTASQQLDSVSDALEQTLGGVIYPRSRRRLRRAATVTLKLLRRTRAQVAAYLKAARRRAGRASATANDRM